MESELLSIIVCSVVLSLAVWFSVWPRKLDSLRLGQKDYPATGQIQGGGQALITVSSF